MYRIRHFLCIKITGTCVLMQFWCTIKGGYCISNGNATKMTLLEIWRTIALLGCLILEFYYLQATIYSRNIYHGCAQHAQAEHKQLSTTTYAPKLYEILCWRDGHIYTVRQAPAQEQHKKLVVTEVDAIVHPENNAQNSHYKLQWN